MSYSGLIRTFLLGLTVLSVHPSLAATESDHFDGKKFFNPGATFSEGVWRGLKVTAAMLTSASWKMPPSDGEGVLPEQPRDASVKVTFVNHSTFVIQTADAVVLTDPVWSKRVSPFSWIGPARHREPGIAFDQLKRVDVVLLSHNHYDHMDIGTLQRLNEKFHPTFLAPSGDRAFLEAEGLRKVQELDWWEKATGLENLEITFTPTQHFSSRGLFDRNRSLWGSYMIETKGKRIYFGGDSGYANHYGQIRERLGSPDLALLPIGAYEPYWFMGTVHMNPDDAVKAHSDLRSKNTLGMHFGTFKLTTEAVDQPVKDLERSLTERHVDPATFRVLPEGHSAVLDGLGLEPSR